ncbi:MAG TPA: branched-chain amino acid ABC transporter permease [Candidatus Limnocylindrales bacterium]|nr:branched-chain amino acid ABC transporter permease [Candidatus Limnocylindrales bacterium]
MNFDALFSQLGQHTIDGLSKGAIYALVALGYTLVYGVLRLINFAHSEVFMVGTFAVLGAWTVMGANAEDGLGMVLVYVAVALVVAALASGGVALAVERIAYRPLRKKNAPSLVFLITAIGVSTVLMETFGYVLDRGFSAFAPGTWNGFGRPFGRVIAGMPTVVQNKTVLDLGIFTISNRQLIVILGAVAMMLALDLFINRTRLGRGVRAVAQDPDTAALMGVNKDRVIMLIFVLGGAMAGGAAVLYGLKLGNTVFDVGFLIGIKAFTAAVLGGIGNLRGALLGGLLLGVIEVYGATLTKSSWEDVWAFGVLVIVLMFRPTGLLGESLGRARA